MDSFEVGGKQYQVVVTHEDGRTDLAIRCEGLRIAALHFDEQGVSSVMIEQCLVVARR